MDSSERTISTGDLVVQPVDERRNSLLSAYAETLLQLDCTRNEITDKGPDDDLTLRKQELVDRAADLRNSYREGVPFVEVSRCPITAETLHRSLDIHGLDGLWWNNRNPIRPSEQQCSTLFAFTGAMKLTDQLEYTSFLAKPGPGVPFVISRLLLHDGVRAVLSCLLVGRHIGFIIAYFADPLPEDIQRANDWGREEYEVVRSDGQIGWDKSDEIEDDYDFELAEWIEKGKLSWVAPGDTDLMLRNSVDDCPYIDLEGIREIQRVKEGELWYPSLVEKQDATEEKRN